MSTLNSEIEKTKVPFFDQSKSFQEDWPKLSARVNGIFDRGKYSHGYQVEELERQLEAYTGAPYVINVNSGTDALLLLYRAAGLEPESEIILPNFTWISPASVAASLGLKPVFVDIDPESYAIDPQAVADAITPRTSAVAGIHLFSQMADMEALGALTDRADLTLLEDSAEAIGMWQNERHAGLHGRGGILSFFPTKTLGGLGDGGAIITHDPQVADRARILRHHGRLGATVDRISGISNAARLAGMNSKMDEILAAVLITKLDRLEQDIARRALVARWYNERLRSLADEGHLRLPQVVERRCKSNPVWYVYQCEFEERDGLALHLSKRGIGTEQYYPRPLHLQPCFAYLGGKQGELPVSERACKRTLALPMYPDLSQHDVDKVSEAIEEFYR